MIQSMTGFGKAQIDLRDASLNIELRSLNSKYLDLNIKMPSSYKDKELELKKLLSQNLIRGKIDLLIQLDCIKSNSDFILNTEKIKHYHDQILKLNKDLNIEQTNILSTILKMPETILKKEDGYENDNWQEILNAINIAIEDLINYRNSEGEDLNRDLSKRIANIRYLLDAIIPIGENRIEKIKLSLKEKIEKSDLKFDENRFEQELIYYLEKQDITEEIVRLQSHLAYFSKTKETNSPNGKKLGFICQEIGREINTIGSKSSDAEMQKIVVNMKDELEKIKEQLLNIL
tara:strand:- start:2421 stop:3287 length:867 start_codon:yes stop_codon:yes gene_type:complete